MKKIRLSLSVSALIFGLLIVFISLISTNQVISYEGTQASQKKFYIGETILPDHVAYPLVAAADRVLLLAVPQREKIQLQLTYGKIRMEYAQALLLKEEPYLANIALTKSQKYVNLAALQFLEDFNEEIESADAKLVAVELKQTIIQELEQNINQAQQLIEQLSPCQTTMAQQLNNNNRVLLQSLK
jgi:MFS superfamily sulfate permease-like transporter